ncbi:hypothetical protein C2E23DRAFT_853434 [Lenzites betulinus]|nr:hypothetical protein C2E23DRAFT_853434 [Lenzites betulinus]
MEDVSTNALLATFRAPPLQFTRLRTLRAHHSSLDAWQSLIFAEGEGIPEVTTTLPSLQSLSLHLMPGVGHNPATPARQDHLWHEMIYNVLRSLVDLSITVTTPLPRYVEGISSVMIASRKLQRLTIRLWGAQLRISDDIFFLKILSMLFSTIATHNRAAVNATVDPPLLQTLETFTILMPYRSANNGTNDFDVPAHLFNGLGQKLASADACPALSAVRVGAVCYPPEGSGEMVSGYFKAIRAPLEARGVAVEVKLGLGEDEWEAWAAAR